MYQFECGQPFECLIYAFLTRPQKYKYFFISVNNITVKTVITLFEKCCHLCRENLNFKFEYKVYETLKKIWHTKDFARPSGSYFFICYA